MSDSHNIVPKIIETQEDRVPDEVTPGSVILERDTGRMSFDASDGERHQVKDPTKLPLKGGALQGDVDLGTHKITKDYTEGNLSDLEDNVLLNKGEVNESIPQSDYEDFNETSKSFIKNRPFYNNNNKLSGNIVKNPVVVEKPGEVEDESERTSYVICDKLNLTKDQPKDLSVTVKNVINPKDPNNPETITLPGFVTYFKNIMPDSINLGLGDVLILCVEDPTSGEIAPLLLDGVEVYFDDSGYEAFQLSNTRSSIMVPDIDIIVVNTVNTQDVKYLDPLFIKPYRPDYNVVDSESPNYIKNKIVQKSYNNATVTSSTYFYDESIQAVYDYGVTEDDEDQYVLTINYKDGTTTTTTTTPSDMTLSGSQSARQILLNPDDPEDKSLLFVIYSFFGSLTAGSGINELATTSLCMFNEGIADTIESWTLSGRFKTVNLLSQDLVKGLVEDLGALREENTSQASLITELQKENQTLKDTRDYINSIISFNIAHTLHYASNLEDYLKGATVAGPSDYYDKNKLFPLGTNSYPFEIAATNLSGCFASCSFMDASYKGYPNYEAPRIYLKLLNAENISSMFDGTTLRYRQPNGTTSARLIDFKIILCHDITRARRTFESLTPDQLRSFEVSGDPSLGRRVKIYGTDEYTFRLEIYRVSKGFDFILKNLDFMDSVFFAYGSPVSTNVDLMVNIIDQLHDYSADGGELPTDKYCTFGNSGKALLSAEQVQVAIDKGWTIN